MSDSAETILQFGAGNFLRAFFDLFVHEANEAGQGVGQIVVVQSTPGPRAEQLNATGGLYHVVLRGYSDGEVVDTAYQVDSVSRAIVASEDWGAVLEVARSPDLRVVVSNTTEKGYELSESDTGLCDTGLSEGRAPVSFPAKLLACLDARFRAGGSGLTILPCELFSDNADRLRDIVVGLAESWSLSGELCEWIRSECRWHRNLVDRIVTGRPSEFPMLDNDPLLTMGEPFALFAIEERDHPLQLFDHPAIVRTPDVTPYGLRKVRIINGAHTALVCRALPAGFETVRAAVEDPETRAWLDGLLFEEIVPTIADRVEGAEEFAKQVIERFLNPFVEHKLESIALHHEEKVKVRLLPSLVEFRERFGKEPARLSELLPDVEANE